MKIHLPLLVTIIVSLFACQASDMATPEEQVALEVAETPEAKALVERSIAERVVGDVVGFIDPFIPAPIQPFIPLLATLFFKRVRRTAMSSIKAVGDTLKKTVTGDFKGAGQAIGDAVDATFSIIGLTDSRNDTDDDLETMLTEANEVSDTALEAALNMVISHRASAAANV